MFKIFSASIALQICSCVNPLVSLVGRFVIMGNATFRKSSEIPLLKYPGSSDQKNMRYQMCFGRVKQMA